MGNGKSSCVVACRVVWRGTNLDAMDDMGINTPIRWDSKDGIKKEKVSMEYMHHVQEK